MFPMWVRYISTIAVLAAVPALFAQDVGAGYQARVELRDVSRPGSPLHVTGYVRLSADDPSNITHYAHHVEASATNVGLKPILYLSIRFQTMGGSVPGLDFSHRSDYFFGDGVLTTGVSESINASLPTFGPSIVNGVAQTLRVSAADSPLGATARVEFVYFQDGSAWGDRESKKEFFKGRKEEIRQLERLENVYKEQGEQAFTDALLGFPLFLPAIEHVNAACRDKGNDANCSLEMIRRMKAAAAHAVSKP